MKISSIPKSGRKSFVVYVNSHHGMLARQYVRPRNLRAPQPVAVLLARSGPEVVDEVEEVQQGVAAAGEPGLTGAAGVSRCAFDL
jgi:hypothetical protein